MRKVTEAPNSVQHKIGSKMGKNVSVENIHSIHVNTNVRFTFLRILVPECNKKPGQEIL